MRLLQALAFLACTTQAINAASIPSADDVPVLVDLTKRAPDVSPIISPDHVLERRKGGGGGGRGGGSSSSSGGGRGSSSSSSGRSGSSGSSSSTSRTSSSGGQTRSGSGSPRYYGGGYYYAGGAAIPYEAGKKTPKGLLAGALILPAAALLLLPGIWRWSVYPYMFPNPYTFHNASAPNASVSNPVNTTLPVLCLCQEFSVCGCDQNQNQTYLNSLIGNGSYAGLNKTLINIAQYNGSTTLILNGTLPNGTTAPGANAANAVTPTLGKWAGYYVLGLMVFYGVFM